MLATIKDLLATIKDLLATIKDFFNFHFALDKKYKECYI
jgi:hypothetical protein